MAVFAIQSLSADGRHSFNYAGAYVALCDHIIYILHYIYTSTRKTAFSTVSALLRQKLSEYERAGVV